MIINDAAAKAVLDDAVARADNAPLDKNWASKIERLSELCEAGGRTHIAAFGTALLAKATDINVDVFALKVEANGPRAYSARSLAKNVLAKAALLHRFDIGASGPEPLNNQPYFRESRISRDMPVRAKSRPAIDQLCDMLTQLDTIGEIEKVRTILHTFITLRRKRVRAYAQLDASEDLTLSRLASIVAGFVSQNAEGGKRAQAAAAAAFDVAFGVDHVEAGRVNDPSRKVPGDILVLNEEGRPIRSIEVRDKPVAITDLLLFVDRARSAKVHSLGFVAIAAGQNDIDMADLADRLAERSASLRVYWTWQALLEDCAFWTSLAAEDVVTAYIAALRDRLIQLETLESGVAFIEAQLSQKN